MKEKQEYELVFGISGNTEIVLYKIYRKNYHKKPVGQLFCGRICNKNDFVSYWIGIINNTRIIVGIGEEIGKNIVFESKLEPVEKKEENSADLLQYFAFTTNKFPGEIQNIQVISKNEDNEETFQLLEDLNVDEYLVMADSTGKDLLTPEQRDKYREACQVLKRRQERFGGIYTPLDVKSFLDSKMIREMQRTGRVAEKGFTTGFDITAKEEQIKREARMKRFQNSLDYTPDVALALSKGKDEEECLKEHELEEKIAKRAEKFGMKHETEMNLVPTSKKVWKERLEKNMNAEERLDAIHLYSLDENFQQVRTNDIMEYFEGYGPSYIEWLNDSSCTIVFEDQYTVSRALLALSKEISPETILPLPRSLNKKLNENSKAEIVKEDEKSMIDEESAEKAEGSENAEDSEKAEEDTPTAEVSTKESTEYVINDSHWRFGAPIGTRKGARKWRILLRTATIDDFPGEKKNKRNQHFQRKQHSHKRYHRNEVPRSFNKKRRNKY